MKGTLNPSQGLMRMFRTCRYKYITSNLDENAVCERELLSCVVPSPTREYLSLIFQHRQEQALPLLFESIVLSSFPQGWRPTIPATITTRRRHPKILTSSKSPRDCPKQRRAIRHISSLGNPEIFPGSWSNSEFLTEKFEETLAAQKGLTFGLSLQLKYPDSTKTRKCIFPPHLRTALLRLHWLEDRLDDVVSLILTRNPGFVPKNSSLVRDNLLILPDRLAQVH